MPTNKARELASKFQHTAARRRLGMRRFGGVCPCLFQHTAARRRLVQIRTRNNRCRNCFNTQPPEGGWLPRSHSRPLKTVSTHSRPKAAGSIRRGCCVISRFQHTAARRRLALSACLKGDAEGFQHTAARRRLELPSASPPEPLSFNTQPPEGGWQIDLVRFSAIKEFQHTAARRRLAVFVSCFNPHVPLGFQHTAARRRLVNILTTLCIPNLFQHTAARRRLVLPNSTARWARCFNIQPPEGGWNRPRNAFRRPYSFNTQPPEGGWVQAVVAVAVKIRFQHTAARRRLENPTFRCFNFGMFQHTAARRRLAVFHHVKISNGSFNTQPPEGGWKNA